MKSLDGKEKILKMELIFMCGNKKPQKNQSQAVHPKEVFIGNTITNQEESAMYTGFLIEFVY